MGERSLHQFGHADIETLADNFDLLVIDHPMAGDAQATEALTELLPLLSQDDVNDLRDDTIGPSFLSYMYHGSLYALPIDAAAPAASLRLALTTSPRPSCCVVRSRPLSQHLRTVLISRRVSVRVSFQLPQVELRS